MTIFDGKIHYKWPFSIAVLVHQRVTLSVLHHLIDLSAGFLLGTRIPFLTSEPCSHLFTIAVSGDNSYVCSAV